VTQTATLLAIGSRDGHGHEVAVYISYHGPGIYDLGQKSLSEIQTVW